MRERRKGGQDKKERTETSDETQSSGFNVNVYVCVIVVLLVIGSIGTNLSSGSEQPPPLVGEAPVFAVNKSAAYTLVWQCSPVKGKHACHWDTNWVRQALEGLYHTEVVDGTYSKSTILDNTIVVDSQLKGKLRTDHQLPYYAAFKKNGLNVVLYHLSDEFYADDVNMYNSVSHVIRPYFSITYKKAFKHKITQVAIGTKSGFMVPQFLPTLDSRKYLWSFIGELKNTRAIMAEHLAKLTPNFHNAHGKKKVTLSDAEYLRVYLDSVFCPAPSGYVGVDTSRLYEALEAGCIPIVEHEDYASPLIKQAMRESDSRKHPHLVNGRQAVLKRVYEVHVHSSYFKQMYESEPPFQAPPFPIVKDWSEALEIVRTHGMKGDAVETLHKQCKEWWAKYKDATKRHITDVLGKLSAK